MTALLASVLAFGALWLLTPHRPVRPPRPRAPGRRDDPPGRRTRRPGGRLDTALMLELLGAMIQSGTPLPHAVATLARVCTPPVRQELETVAAALMLGTDWQNAWLLAGRDGDLQDLQEALRFGAVTGAPAAAILYVQADQVRRRRRQEAERRAAALGTKLVLPLGLCALPAFICLGVLPVLMSLLPRL
ncbi:type II secretion system F family protein [Arthrobacter sp. I2-34]|uniref:Type II secretion system F family protein n=1 Tax=Arthrobacter hankyongi TaxID=2904801 RepID=A0ABS9LA37_9MICC|nr:type II secretion system F family protein [Arthrobacter hankyongi]MCG2623530.1 type II secretion system F family protein [Arthrobacter hankyongi]